MLARKRISSTSTSATPFCCEHFENSHYVDPAHTWLVPQTIPTIFSSGIPNPPQMIAELRPRRCSWRVTDATRNPDYISIDSKPAPHGTMKVVDREVTPFDDPTNMWHVQRTLFGQTVYVRDCINLHHICLWQSFQSAGSFSKDEGFLYEGWDNKSVLE